VKACRNAAAPSVSSPRPTAAKPLSSRAKQRGFGDAASGDIADEVRWVDADSGIGAERGCGGGHHRHLTGSVLVGARDVAGGLQQDAMPHRGGPDVPLDAGTKPVEVRAQRQVAQVFGTHNRNMDL
jgi:hypothetical protein